MSNLKKSMALSPAPGFVWDQVETSNGLSHVCMYVCMFFFPKVALLLRPFWPGALAFFVECLGQDQSFFCIQMALDSAVHAFDALPFLPERMCGMPSTSLVIVLINAAAADESLEALFIGSFVG